MATHTNHHPRPKGWGADLRFENRPGVPRLKAPPAPVPGAHGRIAPQPVPEKFPTKRTELRMLTPVFGTAQLPRGLSGALRRAAYRIPEHKAKHWLMLLMADRVEVMGHRLGRGAAALAIGSAIIGGTVLVTTGIRRILPRGTLGPLRQRLLEQRWLQAVT